MLTWDMRLGLWAFNHIKTGICYIGRGPTGAEVPGHFGGVKDSGSGREAYGLEGYSWVKQGWFDVHPVTRLAQTGTAQNVTNAVEDSCSLFSNLLS